MCTPHPLECETVRHGSSCLFIVDLPGWHRYPETVLMQSKSHSNRVRGDSMWQLILRSDCVSLSPSEMDSSMFLRAVTLVNTPLLYSAWGGGGGACWSSGALTWHWVLPLQPLCLHSPCLEYGLLLWGPWNNVPISVHVFVCGPDGRSFKPHSPCNCKNHIKEAKTIKTLQVIYRLHS